MALTAASTFDDAYNQLNDNQDWVGDAVKARLWLEALRWLRTNRPSFSMRQNAQVSWASLEEDIKRAHDYVASVGSTNRSPFVRGKSRYC